MATPSPTNTDLSNVYGILNDIRREMTEGRKDMRERVNDLRTMVAESNSNIATVDRDFREFRKEYREDRKDTGAKIENLQSFKNRVLGLASGISVVMGFGISLLVNWVTRKF